MRARSGHWPPACAWEGCTADRRANIGGLRGDLCDRHAVVAVERAERQQHRAKEGR